MYAIQARIHVITATEKSYAESGSREVPTFYLDERVQGITSEDHAVKIARQILDPWGITPERDITITAVKL